MASAEATLPDFASGNLPKICVKTGVDAHASIPIRITSAPGWTWILILFGVLPFLVVRYIFTKSSAGRVPITEATGRRVRRVQLVLLSTFVAGVALIVVGFFAGSGVAVGGGVLAVLSLLILEGARSLWWISGRVTDDRVALYGVHPNFARALGAQYHDRPAAG
jgi:hypothetical protein